MNDSVLYDAEGGVATLTFNRPKVLNALDGAMREGLGEALDRLEAERGLRVVVLRGAGAGFMAGGNIKYFTEITPLPPEERRRRFEGFIHEVHPSIIRLQRLPVPVIASVHGPVAGVGMSFLMAADLAIAAEDAIFTLAYIHLGTSPDGGSTFFLPRTVGMKRAMEIALLGERFDAKTAQGWGLVNWVVPAADLPARTTALAKRLASGPARAYAATKRLLTRSIGSSLETQLQAEAEGFSGCTSGEDFVEGVNAFIAKRAPRFQGT
jgi:2-(1,2-epoxy-1,2-dihydrophenyl)acetyl-CoA isomerase